MNTNTEPTSDTQTEDEKQLNKRAGKAVLWVLYSALFWFTGAGIAAWVELFKQFGGR